MGKNKTRSTRSEEHTSELQSPCNLVCRLLLEKKKKNPDQAGAGLKCTRRGSGGAAARWRTVQHAVRVCRLCSRSCVGRRVCFSFFFFNDTATTEIYTLSLHDALPI